MVSSPADGRGSYPRLAARITRLSEAAGHPERLEAAPEADGSELPLVGIRNEGLYLVLSADDPIGYATGFVRAPSGAGLMSARVTAAGLGTADLSRDGGRYAVPAPAGSPTLTAHHPTLDEQVSGTIPSLGAGQVATLDLTVAPVPPRVVPPLVPADGAENVLVLTPVSISFSEQLDPASVSSSTLRLELANAQGHGTSAFVVGTVTLVDGRTVSFAPSLPLLPNRHFIARFAGGVFDTGGTPYQDGPVTWTFTTKNEPAPGGQVHPEHFHIGMPADGVVQIWGDAATPAGPDTPAEPGAVPVREAGQSPWTIVPYILGPVADPTLDSFSADDLGGFTGHAGHPPDFPVDLSSEVWVKVIDPAGVIAEEFRLGPMTTADGRGFVALPGEPTTFSFTVGPDDFPYDVPARHLHRRRPRRRLPDPDPGPHHPTRPRDRGRRDPRRHGPRRLHQPRLRR